VKVRLDDEVASTPVIGHFLAGAARNPQEPGFVAETVDVRVRPDVPGPLGEPAGEGVERSQRPVRVRGAPVDPMSRWASLSLSCQWLSASPRSTRPAVCSSNSTSRGSVEVSGVDFDETDFARLLGHVQPGAAGRTSTIRAASVSVNRASPGPPPQPAASSRRWRGCTGDQKLLEVSNSAYEGREKKP
jgi:hypothetical protein